MYEQKQFEIGLLDGVSEEQINEHLKLYAGYVKHTNLIREKIKEFSEDIYTASELRRRFNFEFNGMRMHELYFEQLEGEASDLSSEGKLAGILSEKYGSIESAIEHFKGVGKSRGVGWVVLAYDGKVQTPHIVWVGDHEIGQLADLRIVMVMDVWEHAFMVDYLPTERGKYIESFFKNLNWGAVERRFNRIINCKF